MIALSGAAAVGSVRDAAAAARHKGGVLELGASSVGWVGAAPAIGLPRGAT